ncbi:MAG: hypothetical protein LKF82_04455 [Acinetobacter populi]|uniref:hypothetical protein n=1 Tax=Acinetobacter populi TaxID=1582270 RepID=UPI002355643E|nr:hypothetical protein [Acinetobacter populi]MCH4247079.1 hypothetical protein [Acinetobacter populi]
MKALILLSTLSSLLLLTACQTKPQPYNGITGFEVESLSNNVATLRYTLAANSKDQNEQKKLHRACQQVLGANASFAIQILSTAEIENQQLQPLQTGVKIGQSQTSFGLSNTPSTTNSEDYSTRQALETRPSTLKVIRYTCSPT